MTDDNKNMVAAQTERQPEPAPAPMVAQPTPSTAPDTTARVTAKRPLASSVLMKTVVIFYTIFLAVWIVFAWGQRRPLYSSGPVLRRIGSSYTLEITLIREDRQHLACASERSFSGLHCAYKKPGVAWKRGETNDTLQLRPYSTVEGEQFLGAGLWSQLEAQGPLPSYRFSVLCTFHAQAAVRDVSVRWNTSNPFGNLNRVAFVGSLTDCVLPQ